MPVNFNDIVDDPLTWDRQRSFTGGQASFFRANMLSEDQATSLQDVDIDTDLALENRRGFRKFGDLKSLVGSDTPQGAWWFNFGSNQFALVLAGGKLYRGTVSGTWTLVAASAAGSTTAPGYGAQVGDTFWLSTGDTRGRFWTGAQLAAGHAGTAVTDGPTHLTRLAALRYRLFGVDASNPDSVYCSKFLPTDATPFTLSSAILPFRPGEGEGDPVLSMVGWKGIFSLVIVKRGSVWMVDTTPAGQSTSAATTTSEFGVQQVGWIGSVAGRSVVRSSNDVLFLAEDGVRSLARTVEDGDGKVSDPLSQPITDIVRRINKAGASTANAVFHNGRYILGVPLDSALSPNAILVWYARTGAWMTWTGVQPVSMVVAAWPDEPRRLLMLDARGHVLEYRDHVQSAVASDYRDNVTGSDERVAWAVKSRALTWTDAVSPKALDCAEFEFDRSEAIIDIDVRLDNDASGTRLASKERTGFPGWVLAPDDGVEADYPGSVLPITLGELKVKRIKKSLTHYENAREVIYEIREAEGLTTEEQSESGVLRLRGIISGAFLETQEADS